MEADALRKAPIDGDGAVRSASSRPGNALTVWSLPLLSMYKMTILIHMKTTLNIDDGLLAEAARLTQIAEKTALVRAGLEALIARESARRLAQLGGSEPGLRSVPRRRSKRRTPS